MSSTILLNNYLSVHFLERLIELHSKSRTKTHTYLFSLQCTQKQLTTKNAIICERIKKMRLNWISFAFSSSMVGIGEKKAYNNTQNSIQFIEIQTRDFSTKRLRARIWATAIIKTKIILWSTKGSRVQHKHENGAMAATQAGKCST